NNMQVCYPSTPAQYFHLLRRQMHRGFRKPLVVMSPKSLLRLPACTSTTDELTTGGFKAVLDDPVFGDGGFDKKQVTRVLMCTGKVYYDLVKRREHVDRQDIAIVRVEQLYPLHSDLLKEIRESYPASAELIWVQEEPRNMGAYGHMALSLMEQFGWSFGYCGRPSSGTPATGSPRKHLQQLDEFLTASIGTVHEDRSEDDRADNEMPTSEKPSKSKGSGSRKSAGRKAATA
ncbi:MAG: hypothetical protein ACNA8P_08150, partial [Phycisphaerales bacterium]